MSDLCVDRTCDGANLRKRGDCICQQGLSRNSEGLCVLRVACFGGNALINELENFVDQNEINNSDLPNAEVVRYT